MNSLREDSDKIGISKPENTTIGSDPNKTGTIDQN